MSCMQNKMPKKKVTKRDEGSKEIEKLKKRVQKAQESSDFIEESKLYNAIGEAYFQQGDYERALHHHQRELMLSEASTDRLGIGMDQLGIGVACRKVGECLCEMGDYEGAIQHQKRHLEVARQMNDLVEEQRAKATLGRTFYVYSQSEQEQGRGMGDRFRGLVLKAGTYYREALEVCDRLTGLLSDRDLLVMRSRLYMNLGLVYEIQEEDLRSAREFTEKALGMVKELGDSETVYKCHYVLADLHQRTRHTSQALQSLQAALAVSKELRDKAKETDTLRELALRYLGLQRFEESKTCLKRVLKLYPSLRVPQEEVKAVERQLKTIRRIVYYCDEVKKKSAEEKVSLYEKLGDMCCSLKAYSTAVIFYGRQLSVAEKLHLDPKKLSTIYVSLALTHSDCTQYSQSLHYYEKLRQLWKGKNAVEECDTWCGIAVVMEKARKDVEEVLKAYERAVALAVKAAKPKLLMKVYNNVIGFLSKVAYPNAPPWQQKRLSLLESHPHLANMSDSEEEEEDSQEVGGDNSDVDFSLSSSEGEEEEVEGGSVSVGVVVSGKRTRSTSVMRNKSKLEKKNHNGETLLQQAVIKGDLAKAKGLIKMGAEVNVKDTCGWTPLHEACNYGYLELTRLLLDHGARVNDSGGAGCKGVTPLMDAVSNSADEKLVRLLVERGADMTLKNDEGQTALALAEEKLASDSCEYKEEERKIRDFLRGEMRRQGIRIIEEATPTCSKAAGDSTRGSEKNKQKETTRRCVVKKPRKTIERARLYNHNDSDEGLEPYWRSRPSTSKPDNPLRQNSTLHPPSTSVLRPNSTFHPSTSMHRNTPLASTSTSRFTFNPLGRSKVPEGPAFVPQETDEIDAESGYPVRDSWLVDDLGEGSPGRGQRRKRQRDPSVERESRALLGLSAASSPGRKTRKVAKSNIPRVLCLPTPSTSVDRNTESPSSVLRSPLVATRKVEICVEDSEEEPDSPLWSRGLSKRDLSAEFRSKNTSSRQAFTPKKSEMEEGDEEPDSAVWSPLGKRPKNSSTLLAGKQSTPLQELSGNLTASHLRIRVRIENSTFLIPCPTKLKDDAYKNTPVSWLMAQASERYFSQWEKRPLLRLTKVDGASLFPTDAVVHVLQQDEEVIGVVKEWACAPLVERYQKACGTAGQECNSKTLELFQHSDTTSALDLSNFGLCPLDSVPVLQALQTQHHLTALNLSGNKLRDDAMSHLLLAMGELSSLVSLDLSANGISHRGIEFLVKDSSQSDSPWLTLRTLKLSRNTLGVDGGYGLSKLLQQCRRLQELQLDGCGLCQEMFQPGAAFSAALKCLEELRHLSLSKNPLLGTAGLQGLFETIQDITITTLNISRMIPAKKCGGKSLSCVLGEQLGYFRDGCGQRLEGLDISYCRVDNEAVSVLVECLEHCPGMKDLNLAGWNLTPALLEPLCNYVSTSADGLCSLDVSGNIALGNQGALLLLKACSNRFWMGEESQMKVRLNACGIESPLSEEFVKVVNLLHEAKGLLPVFKVDLMGNSFDLRDKTLLSSCSFCT